MDDSTKVFRGDVLGAPTATSKTAARPLRLAGAGGEVVAFQVALASPEAVEGIEVDVPDLAGPGAPGVPRARIEVFLESYIDCGPVDPKVVPAGVGLFPDALIPLWEAGPGTKPVASPVALRPHENQVLWFDVAIPRATPPGTYTGVFRIGPAGRPAIELPLELSVHPFEIPTRVSLPAWIPLYVNRLRQREGLEGAEAARQHDVLWRYFKMAHAHRFVTQLMEEQPELDWNETAGDLVSADWSRYDALNGPVLDGSLFEDGEPPAVWKVGGWVWWGARPGDRPHFGGNYKTDAELTPAHARALTAYARAIAAHFKTRGWNVPRRFFYMIDEPSFREHPRQPHLIRSYGAAIDAAGAGNDHMVTVSPRRATDLLGAIDIWANWGAGYTVRDMQARQKLGDRTWFYQQHEPFVGGNAVNNEGLAMRSWPWIAWRYGVDGIFLWVGNFWNQDPYRDARNWNADLLGNGTFFYPGRMLPTLGYPAIDGPVASFRMKALRRGLFDYEYFRLLKAHGGDADRLVARIIRSALNEPGYDPYWNHPLWRKPGDWSHVAQEWDAARREAAEQIRTRLRR